MTDTTTQTDAGQANDLPAPARPFSAFERLVAWR